MAAPTTAVLATGEGPGVTAAVTTAALATGAPMTPRPARPGPSGISGSFGCGCRVGLDRGDDGLDRDPAVGDQLPSRPAHGRREFGGPQVLVHQHPGHAARIHGGSEVLDVLLG